MRASLPCAEPSIGVDFPRLITGKICERRLRRSIRRAGITIAPSILSSGGMVEEEPPGAGEKVVALEGGKSLELRAG
jgi:hypothetical protein